MSEAPVTWLDGHPGGDLPLPDRALEFGDGLFETLLLRSGRPLFLDLHLQRLACGLETLHFPDCVDAVRSQLTAASAAIAARNWDWSALRLTVSRGSGPRGYAPPANPAPRILISVSALTRDCSVMLSPASLALSSVTLSSQPLLAGLKHLNRLEQVLAARELTESGKDEALMCDAEGYGISVVAGNLFAVSGSRLLTPGLGECGVAGTRRRLVLERWAVELGLQPAESRLSLQALQSADELLICNSLTGPRPVACLLDTHWQQHPVCSALFQCYLRDMT